VVDVLGERSRNKDRGKSTNTTDEWSISDMPVLAADILVVPVAATIDSNAEDNEDLQSGLARYYTKRRVLC
jgi:hypothetical protein